MHGKITFLCPHVVNIYLWVAYTYQQDGVTEKTKMNTLLHFSKQNNASRPQQCYLWSGGHFVVRCNYFAHLLLIYYTTQNTINQNINSKTILHKYIQKKKYSIIIINNNIRHLLPFRMNKSYSLQIQKFLPGLLIGKL